MSSRAASPSRHMGRHAAALLIATVVVATAVGVFGPGAAAARFGSAYAPSRAATFDQSAPAAEPIPITPLTGVTSLDATVVITADGTVDGKPTTGDLTARLSTNDQAMSQIDVTGSLLGEVVAQVGGGAVKLFRPDQVSVYGVPAGTYAVVSGLLRPVRQGQGLGGDRRAGPAQPAGTHDHPDQQRRGARHLCG